MKESIFNIYTETEGHKLLFNSLYCGLCEIDEDYQETLDKIQSTEELNENERSLANVAIASGFFVDESVNEIEFLKMHKYKSKFDESSVTITIAPTLACNFQCIYCYEDAKKGVMTKDIETKICNYIESKSDKIKKLSVTWYGGEPLLAKDIIYRMSKQICRICFKNNIKYRAAIVTNGSLLTRDDIERFKEYKIHTIQITLDGPPNIHNMRRKCNSIPNNYDRIVKNINLLLNRDFNVHLRVNVDKTNIFSMEEMLQDLEKKLISKKINIGFAKVSACTDACIDVMHDCFNTEEFAKEYFDLYSLIERYGFDNGTPLKYATPKVNYCGADVFGSFVVDAYGYIYKCWHDVGNEDERLGNVDDIEAALMSSKAAKWIFSDAITNDECRNCKVLPLCMGGCPSQKFFESNDKICDEVKYNISRLLIENYYKKVFQERR